MTRRKQPVREQIEQAEALFLAVMSPDATPEDWDRYEDLVRTSPEHREVFARCEAIWQDLDEIGAAQLSDIGFAPVIQASPIPSTMPAPVSSQH